jgi:hypothetical protein
MGKPETEVHNLEKRFDQHDEGHHEESEGHANDIGACGCWNASLVCPPLLPCAILLLCRWISRIQHFCVVGVGVVDGLEPTYASQLQSEFGSEILHIKEVPWAVGK